MLCSAPHVQAVTAVAEELGVDRDFSSRDVSMLADLTRGRRAGLINILKRVQTSPMGQSIVWAIWRPFSTKLTRRSQNQIRADTSNTAWIQHRTVCVVLRIEVDRCWLWIPNPPHPPPLRPQIACGYLLYVSVPSLTASVAVHCRAAVNDQALALAESWGLLSHDTSFEAVEDRDLQVEGNGSAKRGGDLEDEEEQGKERAALWEALHALSVPPVSVGAGGFPCLHIVAS